MYIDTDILYAVIKKGDRHSDFAESILCRKNLYTSVVTLLELEILVKREISDELSKENLVIFRKKFPKVKVVHFDGKVYAKSQELRKSFDLGIFDSGHAATAALRDKEIASTDTVYDRVAGLKRIGEKI